MLGELYGASETQRVENIRLRGVIESGALDQELVATIRGLEDANRKDRQYRWNENTIAHNRRNYIVDGLEAQIEELKSRLEDGHPVAPLDQSDII